MTQLLVTTLSLVALAALGGTVARHHPLSVRYRRRGDHRVAGRERSTYERSGLLHRLPVAWGEHLGAATLATSRALVTRHRRRELLWAA